MTAEEQATADAVTARAVKLATYLATRPLTRQEQRRVDRAAAVARRLVHLEENRKRGLR